MASTSSQRIGLLRLDTHFPRPLGDIGNPQSYPCELIMEVLTDLRPVDVVQNANDLNKELISNKIRSSFNALVAQRCTQITTSCGFLILFQEKMTHWASELAFVQPVKVVSSSLLLLPHLLRTQNPHRTPLGVITASAASLGNAHLLAAGLTNQELKDIEIQGIDPEGHLAHVLLENQSDLDTEIAMREVVHAAKKLQTLRPTMKTVVLECTNLPPYAQAIRDQTGLQVYSIWDALALKPTLQV